MLLGLGASWGVLFLGSCGGSSDDAVASPAPAPAPATPAPAPTPSPPNPSAWAPNPTFVQGSQIPFDLASTLPADVIKGGAFSVDPTGSPLPAGMTLQPSGLLYAGSATVGMKTGIIFRYTEPG